jgi:hypothetical protein
MLRVNTRMALIWQKMRSPASVCEHANTERSYFIKDKWKVGGGNTKVGLADIDNVKIKPLLCLPDVFCEVTRVINAFLLIATLYTTLLTFCKKQNVKPILLCY